MIDKYHSYLRTHISGVVRTYEEMLKPVIIGSNNEDNFNISELSERIHCHDDSKKEKEEFDPYLIHWYADESDKNEATEEEYKYAILHHIHNNDHHWQYWVYPDDYNGSMYALPMKPEAVIEMLSDWHSFTLRDPESTAYKWYQDNKSGMILADSTIKLIDKYIVYLQEPLSK